MSITEGGLMAPRFSPQPVTQILGSKVLSAEKENIGIVQNLLIDPESSTTLYIVLYYGDLLGSKHQYFAIPSFLLKSNGENSRSLLLDTQLQQLMEAPEIKGQTLGEEFSRNMQEIRQNSSKNTDLPIIHII